MKKSLPALVIFFRSEDGLSHEQHCRINNAKVINRPVKLIKTFVADAN
ncbi:MAG: hypothetical protein ACXV74_00395 [Methylobacter sp.]